VREKKREKERGCVIPLVRYCLFMWREREREREIGIGIGIERERNRERKRDCVIPHVCFCLMKRQRGSSTHFPHKEPYHEWLFCGKRCVRLCYTT